MLTICFFLENPWMPSSVIHQTSRIPRYRLTGGRNPTFDSCVEGKNKYRDILMYSQNFFQIIHDCTFVKAQLIETGLVFLSSKRNSQCKLKFPESILWTELLGLPPHASGYLWWWIVVVYVHNSPARPAIDRHILESYFGWVHTWCSYWTVVWLVLLLKGCMFGTVI